MYYCQYWARSNLLLLTSVGPSQNHVLTQDRRSSIVGITKLMTLCHDYFAIVLFARKKSIITYRLI